MLRKDDGLQKLSGEDDSYVGICRYISQFKAGSDHRTIYLLLKSAGKEEGELVKLSYGGRETGELETLVQEVSALAAYTGRKLYYFKEKEQNGCGELYCDGKKIDSDVYFVAGGGEERSDILYMADYDEEDYSYTLKYFNGKESRIIAADVYDYVYVNESKILLLTDYSPDSCIGEIRIYDGKGLKHADSDASYLIHLPRQMPER